MLTFLSQRKSLVVLTSTLLFLTACAGSPTHPDAAFPTVTPPLVAPTSTPVTSGGSAHSEAVAHYQIGDAYTTRHDYERAIAEYSQAITLDPAYVDAYIYRGSAYENLSTTKKVLKD